MIQAQSADGVLHQFPDGTPDAVVDKAMQAYAANARAASYAPPKGAPQPNIAQDVAASPVGRLAHDLVVQPIEGLAHLASKQGAINPVGTISDAANAFFPGNPFSKAVNSVSVDSAIANGPEAWYRDALAAQRNTPGYAKARATADAATLSANATTALTAPLQQGVAGTVGGLIGGSWDAANASADAQQAAMDKYAADNPVLSGAANIVGGLALGGKPVVSNMAALTAYRAPATAEGRAADYVQGLMAKSPSAPNAAAMVASGKPITSAEAMGKPAEVALGALARRDGATADALGSSIALRQSQAPQRILGDFATASGVDPAAAQGNIDALVAKGRAQAKPLFDQALSQPGGVWNDDLARLAQRPKVRDALKLAADDLRNGDIDPASQGIVFDADGNMTTVSHPTAQAWDLAKKNLNGMVERDAFGKPLPDSQSRGNYNVGKANRDLTSVLRDAIPGYGDALDVSGDYLSMQSAFDRGRDMILAPGTSSAEVISHLKSLSPAEAQAFKGGAMNRIFEMAQNARLGPKIADADAVQQKLGAILGPQNAAKAISSLGVEKDMANFARQRVPGAGSPTAEYLEAMKQQDAPYGSDMANNAIKYGATAASHGPLSAALQFGVDQAKNAAAAIATRGMPVAVRDEAGRLLMLPPKDLATALIKSAPVRPVPRFTRPVPVGLIGSRYAQQSQ